jgi:hypothetical protein
MLVASDTASSGHAAALGVSKPRTSQCGAGIDRIVYRGDLQTVAVA